MGKIQIEKVFQHDCGCCIYNGSLLKDGDWVNDSKMYSQFQASIKHAGKDKTVSSNITCIKGTLYKTKKFKNEKDVGNTPAYYNEEMDEGVEVSNSGQEEYSLEDYPSEIINNIEMDTTIGNNSISR